MLQQFSWTQFLISSAILSLVWYLGLLLTVYRKETLAFISGSGIKVSSAITAGEDLLPKASLDESELMGKSKLPEGLEVASMSALSFSSGEVGGFSAEDAKTDQLGLVPDVLEELKQIFEILAKEDGSKQDFFALIEIITEKYGRIGSHPNMGQINQFIRERAPFAISSDELDNLWD